MAQNVVYVYFPFCVYMKTTLPDLYKNYLAYNLVWPLQIIQLVLDALSLLLSISSLLRKNVRGWIADSWNLAKKHNNRLPYIARLELVSMLY